MDIIAPDQEGTNENGRGQLVVMEGGTYSFKADKLGPNNAKESMGGMEGGTLE